MTTLPLHRPADPPSDDAAPLQRPLTDAEVLAASLTNPERFDRHAVTVHRYLGRRVGELADDLLSETFLVAFCRRADYRPEHVEVRPWLMGIATNLVHGAARAERRRYRALARAAVEPEAALHALIAGTPRTAVRSEERAAVRCAVRQRRVPGVPGW